MVPERLLHHRHARTAGITVPWTEPAVGQYASAAVALTDEFDRLVVAQQRRGRGAFVLEPLKVLSCWQPEVSWL